MTELTLETFRTEMQTALEPIRDELQAALEPMRAQLVSHSAQLATLNSEVKSIRIHVDGLPIIGISVHELRQDMRMMRAAINDLAREHITAADAAASKSDTKPLTETAGAATTVTVVLNPRYIPADGSSSGIESTASHVAGSAERRSQSSPR